MPEWCVNREHISRHSVSGFLLKSDRRLRRPLRQLLLTTLCCANRNRFYMPSLSLFASSL